MYMLVLKMLLREPRGASMRMTVSLYLPGSLIPRYTLEIQTSPLLIASMVASTSAHMAMISPCPRYYPRGEKCPSLPFPSLPFPSFGYIVGLPDSHPFGYHQPLCRHTILWLSPAGTWTASQTVTVKFSLGGAPHEGGHCEFSLSYDGGRTFAAVHQGLGKCLSMLGPTIFAHSPLRFPRISQGQTRLHLCGHGSALLATVSFK
ncbi:hypothetical protein DL89DRAFT_24095 [Linderina pennispora]|uniref:Uncharacterized protein n=1 Tax=Linderina pennispora TaxID=61395 RepID=A0A1Y1WN58_9FUNG|nr:uncharacterized protein DL89DRAFT_24095 [Linderina pennispora]ORX74902.1 hypothetical protein DL89DRAFT_24095 [Linderina pennispora]